MTDWSINRKLQLLSIQQLHYRFALEFNQLVIIDVGLIVSPRTIEQLARLEIVRLVPLFAAHLHGIGPAYLVGCPFADLFFAPFLVGKAKVKIRFRPPACKGHSARVSTRVFPAVNLRTGNLGNVRGLYVGRSVKISC